MAKKELKTVNINFAIEPSFNERLLAQAEKDGRSLSNFIRFALDDYLRRCEAAQKPTSRKK